MSSSSNAPTCASTTKARTSASCMAISDPALTCTEIPSGFASQPPVSMMMKRRPPHSHSYCTRSLVTPGVSSTIASRRPRNRLIKVDLPTFGRPKIATIGKPRRLRFLSSSQMRSIVSSKSRYVESTSTASAAIVSGETVRFESIVSRLLSDVFTSTLLSSVSFSRRTARASRSAVR